MMPLSDLGTPNFAKNDRITFLPCSYSKLVSPNSFEALTQNEALTKL